MSIFSDISSIKKVLEGNSNHINRLLSWNINDRLEILQRRYDAIHARLKSLGEFNRQNIKEMAEAYRDITQDRIKIVTCDKCGCLVDASKAINGKSEIRRDPMVLTFTEKIYTPHYCKRCAFGEKKQKGGKG